MESYNLYEYQEKVVNKVISGTTNDLIYSPTGSGKTVIAEAIINRLQNEKFVFAVPYVVLASQTRDRFKGIDCDFFTGEEKDITGKRVLIASKISLSNNLNLIMKYYSDSILIIDECHHSLESSYNIVHAAKFKRVIGLTATPEREDGYSLMRTSKCGRNMSLGLFERIITTQSIENLVVAKHLSPVRLFVKPMKELLDKKQFKDDGFELSGESLDKVYDKHAVWGDIVTMYEKYGTYVQNGKKHHKRAIGFTASVSQAEKVVKMMNDSGYKFKVISYEQTEKKKKELIKALELGTIDGLVCSQLLSTGFDLPNVQYVFSLKHCRSKVLFFQMVGRAMRTCNDKEFACFVDHGDSVSEFNSFDNPNPIQNVSWDTYGKNDYFSLESMSKKKLKDSSIEEKLSYIDRNSGIIESYKNEDGSVSYVANFDGDGYKKIATIKNGNVVELKDGLTKESLSDKLTEEIIEFHSPEEEKQNDGSSEYGKRRMMDFFNIFSAMIELTPEMCEQLKNYCAEDISNNMTLNDYKLKLEESEARNRRLKEYLVNPPIDSLVDKLLSILSKSCLNVGENTTPLYKTNYFHVLCKQLHLSNCEMSELIDYINCKSIFGQIITISSSMNKNAIEVYLPFGELSIRGCDNKIHYYRYTTEDVSDIDDYHIVPRFRHDKFTEFGHEYYELKS